jgi:hypothetical protein
MLAAALAYYSGANETAFDVQYAYNRLWEKFLNFKDKQIFKI